MFLLLQDFIDLFVCVCMCVCAFNDSYLWFTPSVGSSGLVAEANNGVRLWSQVRFLFTSILYTWGGKKKQKKNSFTSCGKVNLHPGFNFDELRPGKVTATTNSKDVA